ncbi:MAG: tetratricopeptide repeat-containing sulfotransferase family protein [Pseudomonadota bacterium]
MQQLEQLCRQAEQHINQGNWQQAHQLCAAIISQSPQHADAHFLMGIINFELGQVRKAIALMIEAIKREPKVEYQAHLAKAFATAGDLLAARRLCDANQPQISDSALTADTFGVALSKIGLHERALVYFSHAIAISPSQPSYHYNFGGSAKFLGSFDKARNALEKAIALKPDYVQAHYALADLAGITQENHHIDRLSALLSKVRQADSRLQLAHALAKEYEALGEYSKAFLTLQQAKQQKLEAVPYSRDEQSSLFQRVATLAETAKSDNGFDCDEPIFVLGMPRSGTTLVDRILCGHTDVMSAGELQDFGMAVKDVTKTPTNRVLDIATLEAAYQCDPVKIGRRYIERTRAVTDGATRFVDKLPFNFFYIDLITRALPKAKILCLLRDPMDTCIGNFRQLFSLSSPYYHYSLDLMNTAHFYADFYHWVTRFAEQQHENFMLIEYEKMTRDPEPYVKDILAFCNLSWQQNCVHIEQNTAPVSTASKMQVREPINTQSIGRWKRYKSHTEELEALFTDKGVPYSF